MGVPCTPVERQLSTGALPVCSTLPASVQPEAAGSCTQGHMCRRDTWCPQQCHEKVLVSPSAHLVCVLQGCRQGRRQAASPPGHMVRQWGAVAAVATCRRAAAAPRAPASSPRTSWHVALLCFPRHTRNPASKGSQCLVRITAQSVIVLPGKGVQLMTLPRPQVPNDQVGSIIGGQGSNINRIRQTSGARIKVTSANTPMICVPLRRPFCYDAIESAWRCMEPGTTLHGRQCLTRCLGHWVAGARPRSQQPCAPCG